MRRGGRSAEQLEIKARTLCGVQTAASYRCDNGATVEHACVVTTNRLPNGTIFNARSHHGLGHDNGTTFDAEGDAMSKTFPGALHTHVFSCADDGALQELRTAFLNSLSPVMSSVMRAAQRLVSHQFVTYSRPLSPLGYLTHPCRTFIFAFMPPSDGSRTR